jgi:stage V sporulation protein D (sporulation-specific penicillin-binding protein)
MARIQKPQNTKQQINKRVLIIAGCTILLLFIWAAINLFRWQVVRSEEMKSAALNQSLTSTTLSASRGTIYDASGTKVLAQSAQVWTIAVEPYYVDDEDKEALATGISNILGLDYTEMKDLLDTDYYYWIVSRKVDTSVKEELETYCEDNNISRGLIYEEDYKRYYPYGTEASVILGYVGTDNSGLAGIELKYETELSGTAGRTVSAKDALGNEMPFEYESYAEAQDGYDLVLTIDETVQATVEKYLNAAVEKYSVKNGAVAILMNVNDGSIVAFAQSGTPDSNDPDTIVDSDTLKELEEAKTDEEYNSIYNTAYYKQWRNKGVSDTYMPGSVFKMVTASMALDSGAIDDKTTFVCTGSYTPTGSTDVINCWVNPSSHGTETVWDGIANSCNPFFMQVGEVLGRHTFYKYFEAFGMTELTGVDLPGEVLGLYYDEDSLNSVELATETFGQNFTITPIQMITAACTVANGGYLVQPHVVDKMLDSDGNIVYTADTSVKRQVISSEVSSLMSQILEANATTGSGKNGYVAGYHVAGKTGTSEKITEYNEAIASGDEDALLQYVASFCGYAPADNPQYALLVFLDEPDRDTASGGGMAAPVFAQIMSEVLPYLGVESDTSETVEDTSMLATNITGMTVSEAQQALEGTGLSLNIFDENYSDDDVISIQVPAANSSIPENGTIYAYIDSKIDDDDLITVPDFSGLDYDNANYLCAINNLQMVASGGSSGDTSSTATTQSVDSGQKVRPGTAITITFIDSDASERN